MLAIEKFLTFDRKSSTRVQLLHSSIPPVYLMLLYLLSNVVQAQQYPSNTTQSALPPSLELLPVEPGHKERKLQTLLLLSLGQ
jgi:hypothetical protein